MPPSPVPIQRKPSGPKAIIPPLWLCAGSGIESTVSAVDTSTRSGSEETSSRVTRLDGPGPVWATNSSPVFS